MVVYSGWEIYDKLNKFDSTTQSLDAAEVASQAQRNPPRHHQSHD
jgi:hypothetical protein